MPLTAHFFEGKSPDVALVIAGVHGSEVSGIEVAQWILVKLYRRINADREKGRPHYTTIIIPELFPDQAALARQCSRRDVDPQLQTLCDDNHSRGGRYIPVSQRGQRIVLSQTRGRTSVPAGDNVSNYKFIEPNRQFPPPALPLSYLNRRPGPTFPDGTPIPGVPLLDETRWLLQFIEFYKPKRIASVHAHSIPNVIEKGTDAPGIFVDPRYKYDKRGCLNDPMVPTDEQKERELGIKPNPFETNPCKFDLAKDPAFPVIGLIKQLNDTIANMNKDDPKVQNVRNLIEQTQKLFAGEKENHAESRAKAEEAANEAERNLNFRRVRPTSDIARTRDNDRLALEIARMAQTEGARVPGNWLGEMGREVMHYAKSAATRPGFSLGDWGPVDVKSGTAPSGPPVYSVPDKDPGIRDGAPVITVEVYQYPESGAFRDGVQIVDEDCKPLDPKQFGPIVNVPRCKELQAYAKALLTIFLDRPA